ncbi:carbohydrate ABC transporter permease [Paenibacillus contaminans]|uniref:ABC transporter permease n=1 Tax=Paenibacillus contaminans TaxID=450362 RepID=A0A329LZ95_9BACL|nr:carbohydrate ABC transporter permease [Paenibacillus contaminans]RAV13325.1 ABC transporter permease [Paenibacillus contaminans]
MKHRTWAEKIGDSINVLLLVVVAVIMIFPILYIFSVSFSSPKDIMTKSFILWPTNWDAGAYTYIIESPSFLRSLIYTVYITVLGTFTNLFFTSTMAYALTRPIVGQKTMVFMVLFSMLFGAGLIPSYLIVKETGLLDSIWALIIPGAISSYNLIIIRQFFYNIPQELTEAAIIDGATGLQIFRKIVLPLSKPALAAFGLFYAVGHWNNYFSAILYINDPAKWPIQAILRQIVIVNQPASALNGDKVRQLMENPPPMESVQMAAILVATLPILLVYPFLQKHFAKGVLLGSVKG